jgi:hypothetical protein
MPRSDRSYRRSASLPHARGIKSRKIGNCGWLEMHKHDVDRRGRIMASYAGWVQRQPTAQPQRKAVPDSARFVDGRGRRSPNEIRRHARNDKRNDMRRGAVDVAGVLEALDHDLKGTEQRTAELVTRLSPDLTAPLHEAIAGLAQPAKRLEGFEERIDDLEGRFSEMYRLIVDLIDTMKRLVGV